MAMLIKRTFIPTWNAVVLSTEISFGSESQTPTGSTWKCGQTHGKYYNELKNGINQIENYPRRILNGWENIIIFQRRYWLCIVCVFRDILISVMWTYFILNCATLRHRYQMGLSLWIDDIVYSSDNILCSSKNAPWMQFLYSNCDHQRLLPNSGDNLQCVLINWLPLLTTQIMSHQFGRAFFNYLRLSEHCVIRLKLAIKSNKEIRNENIESMANLLRNENFSVWLKALRNDRVKRWTHW